MNTFSHLTLFFCLLGFTAVLSAQQSAGITETTTEYDVQRLASLTLSLDAPVEAVYDPWQDFWEDRYDIDIDRTDKDGNSIAYLADDVRLPDITSGNFALYSNVDGTDKVSTVSISIGLTDSEVVTSNKYPEAFRAATEKLREFRTYFYSRYFDERIAEVRDRLEDARDEREDASSDAEKARKKIQKYEDKIRDLREKIDETRADVRDELEAAETNEQRVLDLEAELRVLQASRGNYLR